MTDESDDSIYPPEIGRRRTAATDETDRLDLKAEARATFMKRMILFIVGLLVLLLLAVSAVGTLLVRERQIDRAPVTDKIAEQTGVIRDCTEVGGKCYDRSQRQLRATIQELNQFGALVAACSSGPVVVTYEQVIRCVTDKIPDLPPVPKGR